MFLCKAQAKNEIATDRFVALRGGKSGQHRAPYHLTGGVSDKIGSLESVAENNFLQVFLRVKVKTCGKSARLQQATVVVDKPYGLKCHVYLVCLNGIYAARIFPFWEQGG